MGVNDELVEFSLRRAISTPRVSGYKPRRFNAGSDKGGQFAPKGMGTVAYGRITDALKVPPSGPEPRTVWRGGPMKIVAPPESIPGSRPDWKPSMTRGEAEQWRVGNVLVGMDAGSNEFYHGTSEQARVAIEAEGFRLSEVEFGRLWGDGVYLTPEFNEAHHYARENPMNDYSGKEAFHGGVVTVFPRVTNPAVLDMTSDKWADAWARADSRDDTGFAGWRATVIDFFDLWEDFESAAADDGIERSGSFMQWVTKVLSERGHDALVVNGGSGMNGRTDSLAVVFDPKDVVAIKGAKPPKWFRDRHGLTEAALNEGIRRLGLKGAVRKRYAKGTAFGGRFLPKGKSPFSAPGSRRNVGGLSDLTRMLRGMTAPGPDDVFPGEVNTKSWMTADGPFEVHEAGIERAIARDIVMGDGRRVRLIVDADMPIADPDLRSRMRGRLDELHSRTEEILRGWEDLAPGAPDFPPYIAMTDKRSPHDADFSTEFGRDDFVSDATASQIDRSVVMWNMSSLGLAINGPQEIRDLFEDEGRWEKLRTEIIDHEIGHIVGVDSGPPDVDQWVNAVFEDEIWAQEQGLHELGYKEVTPPGYTTDVFPRSMGGVTHYAATYQEQTGGFQEDWAETIRLYMIERRTGRPALEVVSIDGQVMMITLKNWSPARHRVVAQYLGDDPDLVEAALTEALGRITSGKFSARRAMFLKGVDGKFVGSRGRGGPSAVRQSRAASTERARKIASDRANLYGRRDKPLKKSVTLGVTPYRGAGKASGDDYYETTRYKGFVNDIGKFADEEGVRVQGIQRVRGVWRGGGEPSAAVTLFGDDESVQRVMDRLGTKYNQDGVLSFRPSGNGDSFRFRSAEKIDPAALEEAMLDDRFSSIAGATILPDGRVEFVNIGGDPDTNDQIEQLAEALGIEIRYDLGNAGLRLIEEDYPRRTNPSSGSQSPVQEGGFRPGRGIDYLPRERSGGPSPGGSKEDQALAEAIRRIDLPGLRSRAPRRYAKGTAFGGRFLPKGVSPFSSPRTAVASGAGLGSPLETWRASQPRAVASQIDVGPMTRVSSVTGRARLRPYFKMPSIKELTDPKKHVKDWTRVDGFHEFNVDHPNGGYVRDLTLRRGRRVRVVLDADLGVARDPDARDAFFQHLERELSVWSDLAPRKRFPPQLLFSSRSYQWDIGQGSAVSVQGTSNSKSKHIAIWNIPEHFGRPNRASVDGRSRYHEFDPRVIDHEIAHSIAPKAGPPDPKIWEEAMVRDHQHHRTNNFRGYVEPDTNAERGENGQFRIGVWLRDGEPVFNGNRSDLYGITLYASESTMESQIRGSLRLHEDWAESVALYMLGVRQGGEGPFQIPARQVADNVLLSIPFADWAPNRARLIQEYLETGNITRGDSLDYPVDKGALPIRQFDAFDIPDARELGE